jgi:hypothetical protein
MAGAGDILALDVSAARMGIARGRPGAAPALRCKGLEGLGGSQEARHNMSFAMATNWAADEFDPDAGPLPQLVAIEAPIPTGEMRNTNFATQILSLGIMGIIRGEAARQNIPVWMVAQGTWRKAALGHGRPHDAKRVAFRFCRELGWNPANEDEAEAAGVWIWACGAAGYKTDHFLPLMVRAQMRSMRT